MRGKIMKNQGTSVLKYASTAQNPIDLNAIRIFEQGTSQVFLPFTTLPVSPTSTEVHYDISRLVTLSERLRSLGGADALRLTFAQIKQLIDACVALKLPLKNLELDYGSVYYDSWADMVRFVYLPFDGLVPDVRKTRRFFEELPAYVANPDAEMAQLLASYQTHFASSSMFNPVAYAEFLGTLVGSGTQVDWSALRASKEMRKVDTQTTALSEGREAKPATLNGRQVHARPASAGSSIPESSRADFERGAHARIDPGTTVLGSLPFDFFEDESGSGGVADGTTVLEDLAEPVSGDGVSSDPVPPVGQPSPESQPQHCREPEPQVGSQLQSEPQLQRQLPVQVESQTRPQPQLQPEQQLEPESPPGFQFHQAPSADQHVQSAPGVQFWLRHRATDEKVQVTGDRFVVGKSKYSTYQVRHTNTVSRSHAIFSVEGDTCWIEDDGSRNGTYVDNRRLDAHERVQVRDGALIRMSDEVFELSEKRV